MASGGAQPERGEKGRLARLFLRCVSSGGMPRWQNAAEERYDAARGPGQHGGGEERQSDNERPRGGQKRLVIASLFKVRW